MIIRTRETSEGFIKQLLIEDTCILKRVRDQQSLDVTSTKAIDHVLVTTEETPNHYGVKSITELKKNKMFLVVENMETYTLEVV